MAQADIPTPAKKSEAKPAPTRNGWQSLIQLRQDMDRMFEELSSHFLDFRDTSKVFPFKWFGEQDGPVVPAMDVIEKDKEFQITAEVPGMDEKDIELTVSGGMLTIKGEKRAEKEEKKKDYFVSERRYGAFHRSWRLPDNVDVDKIEAKFAKGILTVTMPKKPEAVAQAKKIAIAAE